MLTVLPLLLLAPQGLSATEHEISELLGDRWTVEAEVYSQAGPAVVSIELEGIVRQRDFFGRSRKQEGQLGQGTGVVIDSTGLVITNAHVAAPEGPGIEVQKIWVSFAEEFGGARLEAKLLNAAPEWDLALLKIEAPGPFRSVPLGSSKGLLKGEKVIAIGTPFGNDHSITSGILSGYHRNITVRTPSGSKEMPGLLQTDAAINPGNSGGPLIDSQGRLIGVNTAIITPSGASAGIGFAVPVDIVKRIVPQLIEHGKVTRPGLGITVVDDSIAQRLNIKGVIVANVESGSGADRVGLQGISRNQQGEYILGDVIVAVKGMIVESYDQLA
ncbi:MAG: trypsin-like peptidase domain-containing protein, partial [Planctomycetota bacterium]|nr:trypsin-like peptidase domain-containing protein [Planctomycetota bacterium]